MAAIDDLKTAVARLASSVSAELKAIGTTLASEPTTADIAQSATDVNKLADQLDAETATLTAGNVPAPTA